MKLYFPLKQALVDNTHTEKIRSTCIYTDIFRVNTHTHISTHTQWDCSNNGMSMCYSSKILSFKYL